MNKPFDPTKPVQTRDGRKAEILRVLKNPDDKYPIKGFQIDEKGFEWAECWTIEGTAYCGRESNSDLINIPIKHKQTHWYIGFLDGRIYGPYWSEASARDTARTLTSVAAIFPHEIEFTEGEGL